MVVNTLMEPQRYAEVKKVFLDVLEIQDFERKQFLAERCTDPAVREEVESWLVAFSRAQNGVLRQGPIEIARTAGYSMIGRVLGAFMVEDKIGEGGSSFVYLVRRVGETSRYALKLARHDFSDPALKRQLRREVSHLQRLDHPAIVRVVYQDETIEHYPYFVMDFVDGPTVVQWCREKKLDIPTRIGFFLKVLEALIYLHGQGVVHGDLKPANILVTSDGAPKIVDFGVARVSRGTSTDQVGSHGARSVEGVTRAYASPEQLHGARPDHRSDIYSLGVILEELLVDDRPRSGTGLHRDLRDVIKRATSSDPRLRLQSTLEFTAVLQSWLDVRSMRLQTWWAATACMAATILAFLLGLHR